MKTNRGRCLALAAVLAMVVCAFAIALPAGESDATDGITPASRLPDAVNGTVTLTDDLTLTNAADLDDATELNLNGKTLSISVSAKDKTDITALGSTGNLKITSTGAKGILNITVTDRCSATSGSEHVYGIKAGGTLEISDVKLNITVSEKDPYAFAIGGNGDKTFTNVEGQITGGNRGIQMGKAELKFEGSELDITGGEKAVQAKTADVSIALTNSTISMGLIADPGSNTGDDDVFALKLNGGLSVNAKSVLNVQGLRLMSAANVAGVQGKVIVTGDYIQNAEAKIPVKISGLYSEISTELKVKRIDSESAATAGFNILSGEVYGFEVNVDGKKQVEINSGVQVQTALNDTGNTAVTYRGETAVTVTVPAGKTLVLAGAANESEITLSEGSVLSIGTAFDGDKTLTVKNGDNQAVLKNVPANVQIVKGSIVVIGSQSGEYTVSGDVKLQGSVINDLTITSTAGANVVLDDGFSVASEKTLTFNGVSVSSVSPVTNNGTIAFGTNAEIDGTFSVLGGAVKGTVNGGSLILSPAGSNITVTGTDLIISDNARMTVSSKVTLNNVTNNGTITLYGKLSGTVTNNGVINVAEGGSIDTTVTGTGTINNSKTSEATLSGELLTTTTFEQFQVITVTGDLTITEGTILTIKGSLIIPEGVKVTIEKGARLIMDGQAASVQNAGEIVVQSVLSTTDHSTIVGGLVVSNGARVVNNGTIEAAFDLDDGATVADVINIGTYSKLENNKTVKIDSGSQLKITGTLVNAASAEVIINGNLSGNITNSGKVTVNGTVAANSTISMVASGASVEIVSVEGAALTVNDAGLKVGTKTVATADIDSIIVTPTTKYAFKGLVVSVEASVKDSKLIKAFSVSGDAVYSYTGDDTAPEVSGNVATMTFAGKDVVVSDALSVAKWIGFTNNAVFKVSGEVKADAITNSGTLTVTGLVDVNAKISEGIVNAAMYATEATVASATVTTYHYTTLANAVASGSKAIDVLGAVSVDTQFTVEKDIVITMTFRSELTVEKDGFITVADGAKINGSGNIKVKGNLYYTVAKTGMKGYTGTITSEVYSSDETDALYTNLVSAMAAANPGETITLNDDATLVLTSFTIKDGVVLKTAGKTLTVNGSTLTIDGTLDIGMASELIVSTYTYTGTGLTVNSSVVLNGLIQSQSSLSYSAMNIAGAYYSVLKDGVQTNCITTVANAAAVTSDAVGQRVVLEGDLTAGDVTFTGKADAPVTVVVNGKLTASKITLKDAVMTVDGKTFVGTVANATGSVTLKDAVYTGVRFADKTASGKEKLTVSGNISDATNKEASVAVDGTVYADGLTISYLKVTGTLEVAGTVNVTKTLTVEGTVNVNAGKSLVATSDNSVVVVMGAFNVAEATTTTSAGTASISKLFVGLTSKDTVGTSAVVSGNVVLSNTASAKPVAYVLAGSEIPESITKATGVKKTEFFVDDKLWMTAYGVEGSTFNVVKAPVTDADFKSWQTADKNTKFYDDDDDEEHSWAAIPAGTDALYAEIDYNVYSVNVHTDGGFASVSIDGNILTADGNVFTATNIAAGSHKLSATIKTGYEGSAVISIDGKTITGDSFTISGNERNIVINLSGTSPVSSTVIIDSDKDDGMGLTDILLIVLVVLIAVMAIMVALRMMRS